MAFATGVAASFDDLIQQTISFAVTNAGFTNEGSVTALQGHTVRQISKGGIYWNFHFRSGTPAIFAQMNNALLAESVNLLSPTAAPAPGQAAWTPMHGDTHYGPFVGHYLFTDGTCVHLVVELASGIYNHLSFGSVTKYGSWTGGEYLTAGAYRGRYVASNWQPWNDSYNNRPFDGMVQNGTSYRSYIRTNNSGTATDFSVTGQSSENLPTMFVGIYDNGNYGRQSIFTRLLRDSPNTTTGRVALFPGLVRLHDSVSGLKRLAGVIPHVAFLRMPLDMNPKDIINTDWQVFPLHARTGVDTTQYSSSEQYALAYRRI